MEVMRKSLKFQNCPQKSVTRKGGGRTKGSKKKAITRVGPRCVLYQKISKGKSNCTGSLRGRSIDLQNKPGEKWDWGTKKGWKSTRGHDKFLRQKEGQDITS